MAEPEMLRTAFERACGRSPVWMVRAPGRVNLIGEHTDYNEGFVLPMAIEREVLIAAAPNGGTRMQLRSTAIDAPATIELAQPVRPARPGDWSNYPRGVVAGFIERGIEVVGLDLLVHSTVPLGGGLSSSASLTVATASVLEVSARHRLDPLEKVRLCQEAEHRFAGVPCGIMDPFVVSLAQPDRLILLDCQSWHAHSIEFSDPEVSVLIVATNVRHSLAHSEYPLRRQQCAAAAEKLQVRTLRAVSEHDLARATPQLDAVSLKRARHVVSEIVRAQQAAAAITAHRWSEVGRLMYLSHESLRRDFEVSSPELDRIVEISGSIGEQGGVFGARMTGGGFGGCAIVLMRAAAAASVMQQVSTQYAQHFGVAPALFVSRAAAGAGVLQERPVSERA
jgi:galactokinase